MNKKLLLTQIVADKMMECYKVCVKHNIPEAAVNLGTFYYNGIHVSQDFKVFSETLEALGFISEDCFYVAERIRKALDEKFSN